MPVTRSTRGRSPAPAPAPASAPAPATVTEPTTAPPNEEAASDATATESTERTTSTEATTETSTEESTENTQKTKKPAPPKSVSKSRRATRLTRAKEELLKLKIELAAARVATLEAESDEESDAGTVVSEHETTKKVDDWLNESQSRPAETAKEPEERPQSPPPPPPLPPPSAPPIPSLLLPPPTLPSLQPPPLLRPMPVQKEDNLEQKDSVTPKMMGDIAPCPQQIDLKELASAIALAARGTPNSPRFTTELPLYGGSHQEWLSFKAAYIETAPLFSELENVSRLRRSLKGRAKEAVENLLIYNAKTEEIFRTLEARFGRPDSIAIAELERMRALPRLSDNPKEICIFASRIMNIVATLRALNREHYLYSPEAIRTTVDKLTPVLKYKWYDFAAEQPQEEPDLLKLSRFLEREAERCGPYAAPENIYSEHAPLRKPQRAFATTDRHSGAFTTTARHTGATQQKCAACEESGHYITQCSKFKAATTDERWDTAKKQRLCFVCLRYRTRTHHCRRKRCEIEDCNKTHHQLLHYTKKQDTERDSAIQKSETVASTWTTTGVSYLKILPVHVSGPAGGVDTYALLDDGSTVTLVDTDLATATGARGPYDPLRIESIGDQQTTSARSRRVTLSLRGSSNKHFEIRARTISNMQLSPQAITDEELYGCSHLRDIEDRLKYVNAKPQILIGQDNWHLLLSEEVRQGQRTQPVASLTPLGWVLHGTQSRTLGQQTHRVNFINNIENSMDEQLKNYFALESLIINPSLPQNNPDAHALATLEKEVRLNRDGRYEAPLLWREDNVVMPNNYENTLKRLLTVEKKIDRDPKMKKQYEENMNALIEKGYAEPAPKTKNQQRTWYLPHFAVVNPMKPDKMRIVHDAAAKTKGVSLNDHLLRGPDLLQSLPGVLMRFRQHRVAVSADIKEMFMQVKVRPEDRDALRYLWRGSRRDEKPPEEYRMTSLIFGATCSPAIAIFVKNINANSEQWRADARSAVIRSHYVDDFIHSERTEDAAIAIATEVHKIHNAAHYELRQWSSNSQQVIDALDPGATPKTEVELDAEQTERVLGLIWKPRTDELTFNLNLARLPPSILEKSHPTKRETLKILMSLFDPLGLASPVTVRAKQILQEIWRRGTDWDQAIDADLAQQWADWTRHLRSLQHTAVPRCYNGYSDADEVQLHIFVDASELAYAAAIYWRTETADGQVHMSLIAAKAKVAPLKLTSIPRLELQAAVLGSRMAATIIEEHDKKPSSKTFWTDSKTVLTWLKTGGRAYRPFVAHRIAAIEENSTLQEWRWVPTKLNVADDATRDVPTDFNSAHRWYHGPSFLYEPSSAWPSELPTLPTPTGEEKVNTVTVKNAYNIKEAVPNIERFSKWERLIGATARVLQFIDLCRTKTAKINYKRNKKNKVRDPDWKTKKKDPKPLEKKGENRIRKFLSLNGDLVRKAENLIVRVCQQDSFGEEFNYVGNKGKKIKSDKLRLLSLEKINGILSIKTRINAAYDVTEEQKRPPVLDGDHHATKLYIEYVHRRLHHAGVECTINECRAHYWIVRLRPVTRMIVHRCLPCKKRKIAPPEPPTGDLPHCRLAHHQRPFTYTGVDYFGPLTVTVGRSHHKRYVALFTCLTTRAVHLEVAPSLTTDSAVMALRRLIARRGCPSEMWSDNGTNLRGADKELRRAIDAATQDEASRRSISWRFIPPGAPFMGGAWERLVRSVKSALNAVLHERSPSDEVLSTLLAEAELTVNSRPLTHVSVNPEDPEALTPNHFLLHGPANITSPGAFNDHDLIGRTHWRASQRLADMFWARWMKEYLPDLQNRREPHGRGPALKTGDVVLVVDNTLPRNTWPMGVVTATYPGEDGIVRTADVHTKGGTLRRPTKKLVMFLSADRPTPG